MYNHESKTRLSQDDYYELQAQYDLTLPPSESFSPTGQHLKLVSLLNSLGYSVSDKQQAYDLAGKLLEQGYEPEASQFRYD